MDGKNIKSILQDALEDEVPASSVNLLPAVQSRLVTGKQQAIQQGEKMNNTSTRRLVFAALTVAALTVISLATPQGRAFAQNLFQLFRRAESNSFELEPSQQIGPIETAQVESTAMPPSSTISVAEAEAQVGFDVLELPSTPAGFNYLGSRLYANSVSIEYEARGQGGMLIITQSKDGYWQSEAGWDKVPSEAIVSVKIGDVDGEFAKGMFVAYPNETSATWNPDASVLRLRWVDNGIWFEMTKFGNVVPIEYLDQAGMIELAESLQ